MSPGLHISAGENTGKGPNKEDIIMVNQLSQYLPCRFPHFV
jgi:hypothetical protein